MSHLKDANPIVINYYILLQWSERWSKYKIIYIYILHFSNCINQTLIHLIKHNLLHTYFMANHTEATWGDLSFVVYPCLKHFQNYA